MPVAGEDIITAALIVIGDEVLSGRTKDENIGHIAERMTETGIDLREVRVVADIEADIIEAVNALRARYDHVFTTGGIGPTHDDITADSVARAFRCHHRRRRAGGGAPGRAHPAGRPQRVAAEDGADTGRCRTDHELGLQRRPASRSAMFTSWPGCRRSCGTMLAGLLPRLKAGKKLMSRSLAANAKEGDVAGPLRRLQEAYPAVSMGSYPSYEEGVGFTTTIVLRSRDRDLLEAAETDARKMIADVRASSA